MRRRRYDLSVARQQVTSLAAYASLLLAMLYLAYLNLATDAPIQQIAAGELHQSSLAQQLAGEDKSFLAVAQGGNLALHFEGFDVDNFRQGLLMSEFYFRAVYTLYPKRVFVGRDDRVVNIAPDLSAADVLPDDLWLRQHGVRGVLNLQQRSDGTVYAHARAIR